MKASTFEFFLLFFFLFTGTTVAQSFSSPPTDATSPGAIVKALYESITRKPGEQFDWDRFRSLFLPVAIMVPSLNQVGGTSRVLTVEEFIQWVDEHTIVGDDKDKGFEERELSRRIELFGDIAQVFSKYEKRLWGAKDILGRGINAIQLVRRNDRWFIVSISWDEETETRPLPAEKAARFADTTEVRNIVAAVKKFSASYVNADYENLANCYSSDARILPPGADMIQGRPAIKQRWIVPEGVTILHHEITPTEIKIIGDHAYDVGYYRGTTRKRDGSEVSWKGKYLIVWKQEGGEWKIYLDAWNRIDE